MRAEPALSPDAAEALLLHAWPYNVRELEQAMAAAAVRAGDAVRIELHHLSPALAAPLEARHTNPSGSAATPPLAVLVRRDGTPTREELELVLGRLAGLSKSDQKPLIEDFHSLYVPRPEIA